MHPYVIDRMIQERHEELARMAKAGGDVRAARRALAAQGKPCAGRVRAALATALAAAVGRRPVKARPAVADRLGTRLQPCPPGSGRPW